MESFWSLVSCSFSTSDLAFPPRFLFLRRSNLFVSQVDGYETNQCNPLEWKGPPGAQRDAARKANKILRKFWKTRADTVGRFRMILRQNELVFVRRRLDQLPIDICFSYFQTESFHSFSITRQQIFVEYSVERFSWFTNSWIKLISNKCVKKH